MAIEIESSSDTIEQVTEALAKSIEIDESQPDIEEKEEKPPAKPPKAKEEPADEEPAVETEEEEPAEEAAVEEEKPKKAPPKHVPLSRLNEEIRKRKAAERRAEAAEASDEPAPEVKPAMEAKPQTYSGLPEPKIEDFTSDPEKYPDPHAAFVKKNGEWNRAEARAEAAFEARQAEAIKARDEEMAGFKKQLPKTLERRPDYTEIVTGSDVQITTLMEKFVYESEIGPDMLLFFVENPDEAERIRLLRPRSATVAMLELEKQVQAEIGEEPAEEKEKPVVKKSPPSKAPPPISRVKSSGPGPKTLQELAGPVDKVGVDLDFNPDYEKAARAKRRT